ncbi:ABC transporter substrate-binding protein [Paenibacillus sp. OV219]|uniref:ABC transporter substrate-binding protein n=1 Tax=Paenibacillus sp. OV219 TaxID=1884377 RepID=UPI0008D5A7C2|nr:ABC transporter substrate-binding protein [Paenibacillus sp. OV219]SEO74364.1 carbohydrate ABC transporter substrate-binding protein, CUT1 family [Paenibacillus sp. OV219]
MRKTRLKSSLSLTLAIPMIALSVTACGGNNNDSSTNANSGAANSTNANSTNANSGTNDSSAPKEATLSFLSAWNGGGAGFPQDQENNPVAKAVREKTGVTLKLESITTSEVEKLNTIFASDTVPDIVNAPYWSTTGGEGQVIKKAALEGQLLDLTPYLDKYPNVKKLMTQGVAKDFAEFDLNSPDLEGKQYVIPMQTPDGTPESIHNWNYGLYARGDILKALNVNAADIDTEEKLADLLTKIKSGDFKDISGKPVIPSGTMHNGWDYSQFLSGWSDYNISDFREEDGKLIHWTQSKDQEARLLYMRKLITNGLFDPEAFSNTDTTANEKLATGKLAVFGAQSMIGELQKTLYKSNPDMQYELLGPMKNKSGNIVTQVEKPGRSGFPVIFLSAKIKDPDAALRLIDYLNSDEGRLLAYWGIEGKDYTLADSKPQWVADVKKQFDDNPDVKRDEGLNYLSGSFMGAFSSEVTWPIPDDQKTQWEKLEASYSKRLPIQIIDKVSATYLERDWPKYQEFRDKTASLNFDEEFRKACYAKSDAEALKILHGIQDKFKSAGVEDMASYVGEKAAARDDIGW